MRELTFVENFSVTGAIKANIKEIIHLEIARYEIAKNYGCNPENLSKVLVQGAVSGAAVGLLTGAVAVPGVGAFPGWVIGAVSGGYVAGFSWSATCWW